MSRCLRFIIPALLAIFLFSISTLAQQAPPSADTFASSATPTTNYGSSIILVVASGNNTYLKFNLSGVPAGPSVSKATLRLFVDAVVTGGQFDVYNLPSTPSWSESTLKYNTPPPALGASATGGHPITVSTSSFNTFVLIDITSTVQGWLTNPSSNNGVALALVGSTGWFSFDSKESFLTAHQPELEIVLNGPAGVQGPQGPTGATGHAGSAGANGAQGPQGSTGAAGANGAQGPQGLTGAKGDTGSAGTMGPIGLVGPQGPAGTNGTNGAGFTFRNAFSSSTAYATNDVVTFNGSTYVAIEANGPSNSNPDVNPAWTLMAQQGSTGAAGPAGSAGATGPQGPQGLIGTAGPVGPQGPAGSAGTNGAQGPQGFTGPQGLQGATGPQGPAGSAGADPNSRMIFPSFFPGNLSGSWLGGQFVLDQAITVLRIAATAKTPTASGCPAAVFRFTDGTKGQDLVLTPAQYWSDSGPIVLTFAAGSTLQASLRTGSTCPSNTGADANLLVEYKMQASGDTDSCSGTSCGGICTTSSSDPSNCGSCGAACASGTPCTSGSCGSGGGGTISCTTSAQCPVEANAGPGTCSSNICIYACTMGFSDCDHNVNNGCETNLLTNPSNCGTCGNVCASGQSCIGGACTGGMGTISCHTAADCPAEPNTSSPTCSSNICIYACTAGFSDCDHNVNNGCEANLLTNPSNCGTCGNVCTSGQSCIGGACTGGGGTISCTTSAQCPPEANAGPGTCSSNICIYACNSGFNDCDHNVNNGCETNTSNNLNNCGACGQVCAPPPNASAICAQGGCAIGACNAGFADCNAVIADGCEINLTNDVNNCGACGHVCGGGFTCSNSTCVQSTLGNGSACSSNGQCGSGSCAQGVCCNTSCNSCTGGTAQACNLPGLVGTCATVACAPFVCSNNACPTTCSSDLNCANGFFCSSNRCVQQGARGTGCTAGDQCLSGSCDSFNFCN